MYVYNYTTIKWMFLIYTPEKNDIFKRNWCFFDFHAKLRYLNFYYLKSGIFNLMNGQISNLNRSKSAVPVKISTLWMFHFICQKDSKIAINIEMASALHYWYSKIHEVSKKNFFPVRTRRRFDVYTTCITLKRRRMDVKITLCAYWAIAKIIGQF